VIFLSTGEGRVKILSYPSFEPLLYRSWEEKAMTLNGHTSSCISLALQPTARWLASGGTDSIIALWDTTNWICHRTLTDMTGPVRSITFSHDGMYIVGGSDEGAGLEIAHVETGEYVHGLKLAGSAPVVCWHPLKYQLAYSDSTGLKIVGIDVSPRNAR
jgi:THO complex subunit 3